jgi:hypothetical protein
MLVTQYLAKDLFARKTVFVTGGHPTILDDSEQYTRRLRSRGRAGRSPACSRRRRASGLM